MSRERGPLGGLYSGTLLDELVVRISVDLSGFRRGIAEAIASIGTLRQAITAPTAGVSLGDAMTAALVAPVAVAAARMGQLRNEVRTLATEMRNVAALGFGGAAAGAVIPYRGGGPDAPGWGPVIDGRRLSAGLHRRANGQMTRTYDAGSDDLLDATDGVFVAPIGGGDGDDDRPRRRRRNWFERTFSSSRTRRAFQTGSREFPGYRDALDNLGGSELAGGVGRNLGRGLGSRLGQSLGLVGLGVMFGDLIALAGSLVTVIGGQLAGAFAALATPLGLVVAAVTALVALFVAANWDTFREFGEWFAEQWAERVGPAVARLQEALGGLGAAFADLWAAIAPMFRDESGSLGALLRGFGDIAIGAIEAVINVLTALTTAFAEMVSALADLIRGDLQGALDHMGEAFGAVFGGILDRARNFVREFADVIAPILVGPFAGMLGGGGGAANDNGSTRRGLHSSGGMPKASGGLHVNKDAQRGLFFGDPTVIEGGGNAAPDFTQAKEQIRGMARAMTDLVAQLAQGARASDVLYSAIDRLRARLLDFAMNQLEEIFTQMVGSIVGGASGGKGGKGGKGGGGNWVSSALSAVFGGFFAEGGYLGPGKWGIVGEKGPEIAFGGPTGQTIIPMSGAGGGTQIVYAPRYQFTGTAEELAAVRRMVANDRAAFEARFRASYANMKQRGLA